MIINKEQSNKGFTLIELMVSVTLFSVALIMALGAILTIIDLNRKIQAMSAVTNNVNFAVESMIRIIKSSENITDRSIDNTTCSPSAKTQIKLEFIDTYDIFGGGTRWISYRHNCTDGVNTIERGISATDNDPASWSAITSTDDLQIIDVEFNVVRDTQQKVEIILEGLATVGGETSEFIIQTTATRRRI
jgi:prepilin-type N-terminal cleavage/methylation domain-containing protein